jgi:hypothetical protein
MGTPQARPPIDRSLQMQVRREADKIKGEAIPEILMMLRINAKNKLIFTNILTLKQSKLEEIQQSKRVDDDGGGCVGGGRGRRSVVAQRGLDKMQFYFAAGFTQRRLHASDAAE